MFSITKNMQLTTTVVEEFKKPVKKDLKKREYVNSATLHGFTRVWNTQMWERGFWISMLCVSIGFLSYGVFTVVSKYQSHEVRLELKQVINKDLELPAITICNNKRSSMHYEGGTPMPDNIKTTFSNNFYMHTKMIPNFCIMDGFNECTLREHFITYGENSSCMTWNNDGDVKQLLPGVNYGLRLKLYLNASEKPTEILKSLLAGTINAISIVVHRANEYPAISFDNIEVQPGMKTRMELEKKHFVRLPKPYPSKCRKMTHFNELPKKTRYTRTSCFEFCFLRHGVEECGAVLQPRYTDYVPESVMKNRNKNITEINVMQCYKRFSFKFISLLQKVCNCPTACDEVVYSRNIYSIPMNVDELMNHKLVTLGKIAPSLSLDEIRKSVFEIDFYYPSLGYSLIQEHPGYSITEALTDFGGQLGLAVGASALSIIEIVVILYLHFFP